MPPPPLILLSSSSFFDWLMASKSSWSSWIRRKSFGPVSALWPLAPAPREDSTKRLCLRCLPWPGDEPGPSAKKKHDNRSVFSNVHYEHSDIQSCFLRIKLFRRTMYYHFYLQKPARFLRVEGSAGIVSHNPPRSYTLGWEMPTALSFLSKKSQFLA